MPGLTDCWSSHVTVVAALIFCLGAAGDTYTTYLGMNQAGVVESSPLVVSLMDGFGVVTGLLVAKLIALVAILGLTVPALVIQPAACSRALAASLTVAGVLYVAATVHNVVVLQ